MQSKYLPIYVLVAAGIALAIAVAGVSLATLLPVAILLVCPLMMVFMMKAMAGTNQQPEDDTGRDRDAQAHPQ